jgi:hypothetical protein
MTTATPNSITKFIDIEASARSQDVEWIEGVFFPIAHMGNGFFRLGGNVKRFTISRDGCAYISNRLNKVVKASELYQLIRDGQYEDFEKKVNDNAKTQRGANRGFIAAFVNGALYGLMTKYNSFRNTDLLTGLKHPFANNCSGGYVTNTQLSINFMSAFEEAGHRHWGVRILNGQTGAVSLSYTSYFTLGAFTYYGKQKDRARHLGRLEEVKDSLKTLLNAAQQCEELNSLMSKTGQWAVDLVKQIEIDDQKKQRILSEIDDEAIEIKTALDIIDQLEGLLTVRGMKGAVTKTMTTIIDVAINK